MCAWFALNSTANPNKQTNSQGNAREKRLDLVVCVLEELDAVRPGCFCVAAGSRRSPRHADSPPPRPRLSIADLHCTTRAEEPSLCEIQRRLEDGKRRNRRVSC